jgi:hypothetical protein
MLSILLNRESQSRWAAKCNANAKDNRMTDNVIAQGKIENRGLLDQYVAKG